MAATPTLTLAALKKLDGAADPAPFTFGVANRVVSFPDPLSLSVEEAERFMTDMEQTTSLSAALRRWVSEEDYAHLTAHLTARQATVLLREIGAHYRAFFGDAGEGPASATD